MGVELKLTDREFPVSPIFIEFLTHIIDGTAFEDHEWADQLSEELNHRQREVMDRAPKDAERVMKDPRGRAAVTRAYQWLFGLMTGDIKMLREAQLHFHFVNIIGIPRNGGSYLTAELFRSLGHDPKAVPNVVAHDGFPEAGPFNLAQGSNSWMVSLHTMAEYLTMVEIFFQKAKRHSGKIIVPKKLTKGIYAGGFFHRVLGEAVEHIFTLRHPATSCISTYEKSGGLPKNGLFAVRSNIEEWCRRDLMYLGVKPEELAKMDYFDAYLRYWEQYHIYVATTGLSANRYFRVIVYGKERMEKQARSFHRRYESNQEPGEFKVFDEVRKRHPDWVVRSEPVVKRVSEVWERVGIPFQLDAVMECW